MRGRGVAPAVGAVLLVAVAGCSGADGRAGSSAPPSTVVRAGAPPSLSKAVGAVDDIAGLRCTPDATGRWTARGTLRNDTATTADYAVSVFVVRSTTGTVLGQASRVVRVAAHGRKKVVLSRVYTAPSANGVRCVPHVERAKA